MPRRLFWVVFVLSLWCFSRLSSAQGLPSRFQGGIMGEAVLSNGTTIPIQFSGDPSFPVPFNVPLWRDPFTESTYFNLPSTGAVMYSSDAAFGTDISAVTPLGVTVLETDQNNETLLSIQGEGSGISSSVNGEAVGAEEPTDENMQTWISEAEADNPDTTVAFTSSPVLACATTASSSSTTTAASSDAPLICNGTDNLVLFAVDPSVMAATDDVTSVQVGSGLKVDVSASPRAIYPSGVNLTPITSLITITAANADGTPVNSSQSLKFTVSVPLNLHTQDSLITLGGHAHLGNRPLGFLYDETNSYQIATAPLTNDGEMKGDSQGIYTFEDKTDSDENLKLKFTASQFGGVILIKADPIGQPLASGSQNQEGIDVRVPGLLLFSQIVQSFNDTLQESGQPPLPLNLFKEIGGTKVHPGPWVSFATSNHCDGLIFHSSFPGYPGVDTNHYGSFFFVTKMLEIMNQFHQKFPKEKFLINDTALPLGGLFDVGPTGKCYLPNGEPCRYWHSPHLDHRLGKAVDIDLLNHGLTCEPGSDEADRLYNLITHDAHFNIFVEGDHWHVQVVPNEL